MGATQSSTSIKLPESGKPGPQGDRGPVGPPGDPMILLTSPQFNDKLKTSTFYCGEGDYCSPPKNVDANFDFLLRKNLDVYGKANLSGLTTVDDSMDVYGILRVGNKNSPNYLINLGTTGPNGNFRSGYIYGDGTNIQINNQQNGDMIFATNNSNKMYLKPTGNVGLGTDSPQSVLHVKGNGGTLNLEGTDHSYIQFYPDGYATGRKGYFGYAGATDNTITLRNEIGDICFSTKIGGVEKLKCLSQM